MGGENGARLFNTRKELRTREGKLHWVDGRSMQEVV